MLKLRKHGRKTDVIVQETKAGRRCVEQKEEVFTLLAATVPGSTPFYYSWSYTGKDGGCWTLTIYDEAGFFLKSKRFQPNGEISSLGGHRRKPKTVPVRPLASFRANHQPRDINAVLDIVHEDLSPEDRVTLAKALRAYGC